MSGFEANITYAEYLAIQVSSLPELEIQEFLESLKEHLFKSNQIHLIEQVFAVGDPMIDYTEEVSELEDRIEILRDDIFAMKTSASDIADSLEEFISELDKDHPGYDISDVQDNIQTLKNL